MPDAEPKRALRATPTRHESRRTSARTDPLVARAQRRRAREDQPEESVPSAAPKSPADSSDSTASLARPVRRDLVRAFFTVSRSQLLIGLVLCLFGMMAVTQIRSHAADRTYSTARRADLVDMLDTLDAESRRLESEQADLERTKQQLQSGADRERVARDEAQRRIDALSILAGTAPAHGTGVKIVISAPKAKFTSDMLLDAIEEMRDAGAEVIEINDSVRVVASTWFATAADGGIIVDDKRVDMPLVIEVIGAPEALEEAAKFRGGIVSQAESAKVGGQAIVTRQADIVVDSLHQPKANRYARPS